MKPTPENIAESPEFKGAVEFLTENNLLKFITDEREVIRLLTLCNLPTHVRHPTKMDARKCLMFSSHGDKSYIFCMWFGYDSEDDNGYSAMEFDREFLEGVTQTEKDRWAMMLLISGCMGFHLDEISDDTNWTRINKDWNKSN